MKKVLPKSIFIKGVYLLLIFFLIYISLISQAQNTPIDKPKTVLKISPSNDNPRNSEGL